jgi:hypothetical protein
MFNWLAIYCCCWLLAAPYTVYADAQENYQQQQVQKGSFSESEWKSLKNKVKISEPKPKKKKEEAAKKEPNKKPTYWDLDDNVKQVIKWGLFLVLIGVLLFLVLNTLGINPFRNKKIQSGIHIDIETIAEHLDEADLDPFLIEAIKSGNYKLAIRLYYLQIVQRLNYAGKIKWKRHKTNKHYVNEMRAFQDYPVFRDLTLTYEKCWFGPDVVNKENYEEICPQFINYAKNIPTLE